MSGIVGRWQRLLRRFAELGPVERGLLPLGLALPIFVQILLWQWYVLSRPDRDELVHVAVVKGDVLVVLGLMVAALLLFGVGAWLRKRRPGLMSFQYLTVQFFALSMIYFGYEIGTQGFVNGVVLLGAPMIGLIMLDRGAVLLGFVSALVVMVSCAFAGALGYLPYAPVLMPAVNNGSSLFWLLSTYYFTASYVVMIIVLTDQMLASWREREVAMRLLSRTDGLTGLHNRRHILELLEIEVGRCRRQGLVLTVVMMDLDNFKLINDRFGHLTGDRVLRTVATMLLATLRQHDAAGRYGGEEFLMLLTDTDMAGATRLTERCCDALAAVAMTADNGQALTVSGSFGVACTEQYPEYDASLLIRQADLALYRAKAAGRNRVEVAGPVSR